MFKSIVLLALIACLGQSVIATPYQTGVSPTVFCGTCKSIVAQFQSILPDMRPQLDELCRDGSSSENVQDCLNMFHEVEDYIEQHSQRDVCAQVGFCRPENGLKSLYNPAQSQTRVSKKLNPTLFCGTCKSIVAQFQSVLPNVRPQLDELCRDGSSSENVQDCLNMFHEVEDYIEHHSPRDVCAQVGACRPANDLKSLYHIAGQF